MFSRKAIRPGIHVAEDEYDPAKAQYHPVRDACWAPGRPVPYLALARTLQAIEQTASRLKTVTLLANYFRSVLALTPEDLLPSVYMCLNQLAPAYHSLELGVTLYSFLSHSKAAPPRSGSEGTYVSRTAPTPITRREARPLVRLLLHI